MGIEEHLLKFYVNMRWPIILFKECSNRNMTTTTNKDDLVSCSPTQVRHTLWPQDVGWVHLVLFMPWDGLSDRLSVRLYKGKSLFVPAKASRSAAGSLCGPVGRTLQISYWSSTSAHCCSRCPLNFWPKNSPEDVIAIIQIHFFDSTDK